MYVHSLNPVLLHLGPLEIRYYGLVYAGAFLVMLHYLGKLAEQGKLGMGKQRAMDFVTWVMLSVVLGSRVMHVLTRLPYYVAHPADILAFWNGGLAFLGGLLGGIATAAYLVRRWKLDFWAIADRVIVPVPLFLALGRVTNFINGELPGKLASVPWAVQFPDAVGFRHPSVLYEALLLFLAFLALLVLQRRALPRGALFWWFVLLYGSLRSVTELFREVDELAFLGLSWMHFISLGMIVLGAWKLQSLRKSRVTAAGKSKV
ncbi:prolipoprotein diacylglyceryl transferase [Candidatus Woesearchaeota archaeon]|nr:prolipoprotein diacylglyceryl transferase [Candidatus Woesearchaeota archaeon]